VERNFGTAQDRLVKGMRVAGVKTVEQANEYLTHDYLAWWERELTVAAASGTGPRCARRTRMRALAGFVLLARRSPLPIESAYRTAA
jgi:hypothetical protein